MTDKKEHLIHWLRDAYAMEQHAIEMIEKQARRIQHYPDFKQRLTRHLKETKNQAERLEQCLDRLGESPSAFKSGISKVAGTLQALSGMFVSDEIVKGSVASYVFEHFEIGNYRALIAAAEAAGEPEIARLCQENLEEEIEMAKWMEDNIAGITQQFLIREETDSKRASA